MIISGGKTPLSQKRCYHRDQVGLEVLDFHTINNTFKIKWII